MKTWIYSWIYNWIVYPILFSIAIVISFFNRKMRKTLALRSWKDFLSLRFNPSQPIEYWIHAASQGELEYAIPLIIELSKRNKHVLITYYSISAKESVEKLQQKFSNVLLVVPLPHDGLGLMKEFIRLMKRQGLKYLLLMKYELWPGLLWECNFQQVKIFLVNALKPGWFHKKLIHKVDAILSGYESEIEGLDHDKVAVLGDTRVERVLQRLSENQMGKKTNSVVLGSMWPLDDAVVMSAVRKCQKQEKPIPNFIWIPHEMNRDQEVRIRDFARQAGFLVVDWSEYDLQHFNPDKRYFVIVMKKGILTELYGIADKAYVGGGFGRGVHSVWEPMLAGAYVGCGPRIKKSPEANLLSEKNILKIIRNEYDFISFLSEDRGKNSPAAVQAAEVTDKHKGAACRIINFCEKERQYENRHDQA